MNKLFFLKLFLKAKFYGLLCKINIHPLKYYSHSFKKSNVIRHYKKVIDVHVCKLCNKNIQHERN